MERNARDDKTGLLYHGWDESRRQHLVGNQARRLQAKAEEHKHREFQFRAEQTVSL